MPYITSMLTVKANQSLCLGGSDSLAITNGLTISLTIGRISIIHSTKCPYDAREYK